MKEAEIMTLLHENVAPESIERAIIAGNIQSMLRRARTMVHKAKTAKESGIWPEDISAILDEEAQHPTENTTKSPKSRDKV